MKDTYLVDEFKPGSKNKLRPGNAVRIKPKNVKWHAKHLSWWHGIHVTDDNAYSPGEKEIGEKSFGQIYLILRAHLSGKMPVGVVTHFGSSGSGNRRDKKCVWAEFKLKTKFGTFKHSGYFEEEDLVKVKK